MTAYQGGTVWIQAVPSFDGFQKSLKRGVRDAFAGAGIDKDVRKAFEGVDREAAAAGEKAGRRYSTSFGKLTGDRIKRMQADFRQLSKSLPEREFAVIEARLDRISKMDLSKVTNQARAVQGIRKLREEFQGMLDAADRGQRNLSNPARWNLGAIRDQADQIAKTIERWSAPDPNAAKRQAELQRLGQLQARAEREMGAEEQRRMRAREQAYRRMQSEIAKGVRELDQENARAHRAELARQQAQARGERDMQREIARGLAEADRERQRSFNQRAKELGAQRREIEVKYRVGLIGKEQALAGLKELDAVGDQLERDGIDLKVDVDGIRRANLQAQLLAENIRRAGVQRGGGFAALLDAGAAANAVRVFNGVLFTTLALGPLLIPVLGAVGAAIAGIGAMAFGAVLGIGALVAGLAGVGGAIGAMAELDRAKREERSGAGAERDAAAERRQAVQDARAVADAQKQLARARRSGAEAIADADRRVVDAEQNLSRAHEDAGRSAARAAERTRDARENLARTNEQAARAATDAARRVRDAEQSLVDAQRTARESQLRLNEARRQAVRDLEDMNNALDSARLNERSLEYQLEEASVHLNVVLEDDQATQREKDVAQLRYEQAVEALEQQRLETRRLEADTAEANRKGVEGSDRVRDAKDRINEANRRVKSAEEQLADARAAADRQAIDNARALRDAREAVAEAMQNEADVARDNAERINDAEQALADARAGRAEAARDAAESIADAQQSLARVHEDIALRSQEAALGTDSLATAQDNLTEALRNLSPSAIAFATWLYGLEPLLRRIRFAAQEGLLPGLQDGLQAIVDRYGPAFVDFVGEISTVVGDLSREFGNLLANNPIWQDFFATMADFGPVFVRQFGEVTINLLTAFASIMTAWAPFFAQMGDGLVSLTERFADWAAGLEDSTGLQHLFEYIIANAPKIGELLDNIGTIFVNLMIGLAPYADQLLDSLLGITDWLADMDPDDLAALALGIGGVVLAVQALAGAMSVISGTLGLIGGVRTLGLGIAGLGGKGAAGAAGGAAAKGAQKAVGPATAAALEGVGAAGQTMGKRLLGVFGPIGLITSLLWLLWDVAVWLDDQFNLFGGTTDKVTKAVGGAFSWLWEKILKPVWDLILGVIQVGIDIFTTLGNIIDQIFRHIIAPAFNWLWEKTIGPWWREHIQPVLKSFGEWVEDKLPAAFDAGVTLIENIWQSLLNILRAPVRLAVDVVFNKGLIGSFNWLARRVPGMEEIDPIDIPAALYPNGRKFATGGVLPGYTPGRDVHTFVSPTAGVLELSGGEPILRPEAGRVLGHDWVHGINAAARSGGTAGVARFLGVGHEAHADGGFFGDVLDKIKGVGGALANPLGFFEKILDQALDSWGGTGIIADAVVPMVTSIPKALGGWIGDLIFGGDTSGAGGGKPAGALGWQTMWQIVKNQFPGARLHSAFRPGAITAVGTPSYHGQGRAIDITPDMDIFNWLARTFRNATELIFSPAGGRQLWNGRNYLFGEPTRGDHWDHIHWAMKTGGILPTLYDSGGDVPPGLHLIANATRKPEVTLTNKFVQEMRETMANGRGGPLVEVRDSSFGSDPAEIAWELDKLRRDRYALVYSEMGEM
jgi:hypothetical protein